MYDVGQQDDVSYLVMQYLEGETLAARLARSNGPWPLSQVLTIGAQLADALEKTHRVGLTHRDLKPANVMLTKSGPRLLDFGLAKITDTSGPISMSGMTQLAAHPPLTAAGTIVGTIHYLAPEQVEGRDADARTVGRPLVCRGRARAHRGRSFTSSLDVEPQRVRYCHGHDECAEHDAGVG